jgi:hypothetical protein
MRTLISVLILAALFPSLNEAQTARHSRRQSANPDQAKLEAQRRYDPLAGQKHLQDGPLDKFLDSINPRDRDFGALIGEARERLVEQTAENSYFWIILGQSFTILILVSYMFWLFRQRNNRLEISVNIVTQLVNSYLYTRSHAIDAIGRHNRLVDDYNELAEKQSRRQDAAITSLTAVVSDFSGKPTIEIPLQTAAPLPLVEAGASPKPNLADRGSTPDIAADGEFMTKKQMKALIEETKRTSALGAKHQISALTQQVRNLREQLNQALTQVQQCEKQHRRSVGA